MSALPLPDHRVVLIAILAVAGSLLLSPAYLVHGRHALLCNVLGCTLNATGTCDEEFDLVREVFVDALNRRGEHGGAVAVYFRGELVVDLHGGPAWDESAPATDVRSFGGVGHIAMALLVDDGVLALDTRLSEVWPAGSRHNWLAPGDVTVGDVLTQRFTAAVEEVANPRAADPSRATRERLALRHIDTAAAKVAGTTARARYSYNPHVTDAVVATLIPVLDPEKRDLVRFYKERVAEPLGVSSLDFDLVWPEEDSDDGGFAATGWGVFADLPALALRTLIRETDRWCGPFPLRAWWFDVLFETTVYPGALDYIRNDGTLFRTRVPVARATPRGLGKIYASVASAGFAGVPHDDATMIASAAPPLFKGLEGSNCVAQRLDNATGHDTLGRNMSYSACGFPLTTDNHTLFDLKETETMGRRWMHFGWSGLGGTYVASSLGHDLVVAYQTLRQGGYDKDPRTDGVVEATGEVVYWIEMEEFTKELNARGMATPGRDGSMGGGDASESEDEVSDKPFKHVHPRW